jgi:hypothetical protein
MLHLDFWTFRKGPFSRKNSWLRRLRKKNGKLNEMPCHHKLEAYLDAYIDAAGIGDDRKGPLFRAALGKTRKLGSRTMSCIDVWYMVRRRAADAWYRNSHWLPHVPRHRDHGLSYQRLGVSKWRKKWPVTPTRKPPGFMICANDDINIG